MRGTSRGSWRHAPGGHIVGSAVVQLTQRRVALQVDLRGAQEGPAAGRQGLRGLGQIPVGPLGSGWIRCMKPMHQSCML